MNKETQKEIVRLYTDEKMSSNKIAARLSVKIDEVFRTLKAFKIKRRSYSEYFNTHEISSEHVSKMYQEENLTLKQIADKIHISPSSVKKILLDFGIKMKPFESYHFLSDELREKVLLDYKKGDTFGKIAAKFGITDYKVRKILIAKGVSEKEFSERRQILSKEDEEEMLRLYFEENISYSKLVKKYKIANERFPQILAKYDLKVKPRGQYKKVALTEEQEKEIVDKIKSGILVTHLLKSLSFKCSERIMRRYVEKNFPLQGSDINKNWQTRYSPEVFTRLSEERSKRISAHQTGKTGSAYGKPPSKSWSRGYFGYYKEKFHFRSLLELSYIIYLEENRINWQSGEDQDWLIEYKGEFNEDRTYWPDFLLNGNEIVEIKPSYLHSHPDIVRKSNAAIKFCEEKGWKFEILDPKTDYRKIKQEYLAGLIVFGADWDEKFNKRFFKRASKAE